MVVAIVDGGGGAARDFRDTTYKVLLDLREGRATVGRATFSHNIIFLKYAEPGGAELSHGGALAPLKIG